MLLYAIVFVLLIFSFLLVTQIWEAMGQLNVFCKIYSVKCESYRHNHLRQSQFLIITSGVFECGKVIRGFWLLQIRIRNDECTWLHGGCFLFQNTILVNKMLG
jgi:hypothetical protein